jgi:uncharacterized glyoxalase superfamily protein PhnB
MLIGVRPMIHVPDVRATVDWYQALGFTVRGVNEDDGRMDWATLALGDSEIMLNACGKTSSADRREVDLYVTTDDVDGLYRQLQDRVEIVEALQDTFYGMREFVIRDLNRFWITFGQDLDGGE